MDRTKLHERLLNYTPNVYFNPPETVKLKYPCIIYTLADLNGFRADNKRYLEYSRYTVNYITREVDSNIPDTMLNEIENSGFDRFYAADGLQHFVLTVYSRN